MLARWMGRSLDKWGGRREIRSLDLVKGEWDRTAQQGR
jgi:hypothetical protein